MQVLFPQTLSELQTLLLEIPEGKIMAGGSDLLVKLRQTGAAVPAVFCLEQLSDLRRMGWQGEEFYIGAAVTQQQLLDHVVIAKEFAGLHQALEQLASPPIRHVATLVGNICSASPAADSLPPLFVVDAKIDIEGPQGRRSLVVDEFILGPGKNCLQPGEFVSGVRLPRPSPGTVSVYHKVGKRKALAIAVVSMAAAFRLADGGEVLTIRLALGSVWRVRIPTQRR